MIDRPSLVILALLGGGVVCTLPTYMQAQDSTTVRAVVRAESAPLPDATVRIGDVSRTTDSRGQAAFMVLAGVHTMTATKIGYRPDSTRLAIGAGQDTVIALRLTREAVTLEGITVSSTRSERRIEEQPLRVEVLAREEVEEKLLMTPGDISMMLNESGGMRVQNTSPSLGGANVRIQGLRGRYSLLLSDGLPLYGGQAGGLGLLQVPPMDLGQVEVIKGAASALYGSAALGGVINLISRKPDGERELLLNGTTLGGTDAVLWTTGRLSERWGYTFLGSGHRQGSIDRDDDGWTDVPGYRRLVTRPRLLWESGEGHSLFLTTGLTVEGREGGTVAGGLAPDGSPYAEDLTTTRLDFGSVGRFPVTQGWFLTTRLSGMTQWHDHTFGSDDERDSHGTAFGEAAVNHVSPRGATVLGLALQAERYRNQDLAAFDFTFTTPGLFLHQEWSPVDRLTLAASGRLDHHSTYGTFVNPRMSVLLKLGRTWTARASAGTGYYAPTPFTEETEVTGLAQLLPLRDLRAEKARSASLDLGGTLGRVELNGTLFGSIIDRAVQLRATTADATRYELFNALSPTRTYGGELLARYKHEPWHLTASYTHTHSTEPNPDSPSQRREVALTPGHNLGLVGMWEEEGRTRIGMEFYYTGRQALDDNPYRATSKPYVILGAVAQRRIGLARIFINFENITNVRQTKYDRLVLPERSADGRWTTDAWAPLEGRVINGGVRLAF